jgi:hypothetical protein
MLDSSPILERPSAFEASDACAKLNGGKEPGDLGVLAFRPGHACSTLIAAKFRNFLIQSASKPEMAERSAAGL